jgi:tellurite resistance protein TerC
MQTIASSWLRASFPGIVLVSFFVDMVTLKKQGPLAIGVKEALNRSQISQPENMRYGATRLRQDFPPT